MTRCSRCNRPLTRPVTWAGMSFGATCAKAVGAAAVVSKTKRKKPSEVERDPLTRDLFEETK